MKCQKNLMRLLNANYLKLTNRTFSSGSADMPRIDCNIAVLPDFIALYSEPGLYRETDRTAVAFYEYDSVFDGKNGLYQAIYCGDAKRLKYFKKRFENVKYAIVPDYSLLGDVHEAENVYRMFKARIAGLWFMFEIGAAVIPNITLCGPKSAQEEKLPAFSDKGHVTPKSIEENMELFIGKSVNEIEQLLREHGYLTEERGSTHFGSKAEILVILNPSKDRNITQVQVSPYSRRQKNKMTTQAIPFKRFSELTRAFDTSDFGCSACRESCTRSAPASKPGSDNFCGKYPCAKDRARL